MIAVKYSDGSFYPVWWIVDSMVDPNPVPPGYVLITEVAFDQYIADTAQDRQTFNDNVVELPFAKQNTYVVIDLTTEIIIKQGFTFEGYTFSMSANAQINWSNLLNIPDGMFPLPVMSINEEVYMLSLANRQNFYLSALNSKNNALQSGSVLKGQIAAMTTLAEVESFVDPRV